MSKNQKIIIALITVFVIVVMFSVWWFYQLSQDGEKTKSLESFVDTYIFGSPSGSDDGGIFGRRGDDLGDGEDELAKLRKITSVPVAGFISYTDDRGDTIVRYIEKATGHIYEAYMDSTTVERLSNTTIPKIQNTVWVDKDNLILQYLDGEVVKSFYGNIVVPEEEGIKVVGKTEGVFLWDDVLGIVASGDKIMYFLENTDGSRFFQSDLDGENSTVLFDTPLTEWLMQKPSNDILSITSKPSATVSGYVYLVDKNIGKLEKILDRTMGLTTLVSNNAKAVIFSRSRTGGFDLNLHSIEGNETSRLDINTLPEKCVWNNEDIYIYCGVPNEIETGFYPDIWYQGLTSFSDNIVKLDTRDGELKVIASPSLLTREEIDLIKLELGPKEENLFFINKKDSSLWVLELMEDKIEEESINVSTTTATTTNDN